jgi:hypothetical protein
MTTHSRLARATALALAGALFTAIAAPAFAQRNETVYRPGSATYLPGEGGCWNELGNGMAKTPCGND